MAQIKTEPQEEDSFVLDSIVGPINVKIGGDHDVPINGQDFSYIHDDFADRIRSEGEEVEDNKISVSLIDPEAMFTVVNNDKVKDKVAEVKDKFIRIMKLIES